MKKAITFLFLLSAALNAGAQFAPQDYPAVSPAEIADAGRFSVSMAVIGPDWPLYSNWGHCAMIVSEIPTPENRGDLTDMNKPYRLMYDYGVFDMGSEGFFKNFAFGIMNYTVIVSNPDYSLRFPYRAQKRSVEILDLNLPPEGKMRVVKYLRENVKPENAFYRYNFFKNNCSTILRDILDMALDGELYRQTTDRTAYTMREWTFLYLDRHFWTEWGFDYVLGPSMDHKASRWETMFMPAEMLRVLPTVTYIENGKTVSLVADRNKIADAGEDMPVIREKPARTEIPSLLLGILTGAVGGIFLLLGALHPALRIFGGIYTAVISTLLFGCSLILIHFMAFTEFDCTYGNWNLLAIGPITLILTIASCFYAAGRKKARLVCAFGWFLCLLSAVTLIALQTTEIIAQSSRLTLTTVIPVYTLFLLGNLLAIDPKKGV